MVAGIRPSITIEWSPTTDPLATPSWTAVTGWRSIQTNRGRQNEVDQMQPGTASIVLDNRTRRFDPLYTAGPNYGNVLPMKRFRIRATYSSVTYDIFQGFVDSWDQAYVNPNDGTVEVRLIDFFDVLNGAIFSPSPYEVEVRTDSPRAWYRLGEPVGTSTVTDVVGGVIGTVLGGTLGAAGLVAQDADSGFSTTGAASEGIAVTQEGAGLKAGGAVTIELLMSLQSSVPSTRHSLFTAISNLDGTPEVEIYISEADGKLNSYVHSAGPGMAGVTVATDTVYHVALTNAGGYSLYVNGVKYTNAFGGGTLNTGPFYIASRGPVGGFSPIGTVDDVAIYDTALSDARISAHAAAALAPWADDTTGARVNRVLDYINVAAADRNVDTTTTTLQDAELGQSLLAHLQQVDDVEQGLLFITKDGKIRFRGRVGGFNLASQATFGDGAGELRYHDIRFEYSKQLIYNVVRRQNQDGLLMEASDTTSIGRYGRRVDSKTGMIGNSDLAALDLATYRLSRTKDPVTRITAIDLLPERDPTNLYPQVFGREIGEQVTINRRPQGVGSAISFDARIEGISHTFTPSTWETTFRLSPADAGRYLQLDLTSGSGLDSLVLAY